MNIYDLHVHTHRSICGVLRPKTILKIAKRVGLNGVAVTDHNTILGGQEVYKLNKDKDFEVIPGIEVSTDRGHLLGLYVNKEIKSRDFFEAVDEIKKQGGITIMAHPYRRIPRLRSRLTGIDLNKYLNAIECYNGRTFYFGNIHAEKLAEEFNLAKTAGSDAHFSFEIGRNRTIFEGSLRTALMKKKTELQGSYISGLAGSLFSFFKKTVCRRW